MGRTYYIDATSVVISPDGSGESNFTFRSETPTISTLPTGEGWDFADASIKARCADWSFKIIEEKYFGGSDLVRTEKPFSLFNRYQQAESQSPMGIAIQLACGRLDFSSFRPQEPAFNNPQIASPSEESPNAPAPKSPAEIGLELFRMVGASELAVVSDATHAPLFRLQGLEALPIVQSFNKEKFATNKGQGRLVMFVRPEVSRSITNKKQTSKFKVGTQLVPNPEYQVAMVNYQQAVNEQNQTIFRNSVTPTLNDLALTLKIISETSAAAKVSQARNRLDSTPQYLNSDVFQPYQFDTSEVTVKKILNYDLVLIDYDSKTYAKAGGAIETSKRFSIAQGVSPADDNFSQSRFDTEDELNSYETTPQDINLSQQLEPLIRKHNEWKSFTFKSVAEIVESHLPTMTTAMANDNQPSDPRYESVVILVSSGSSGSGFYISPNLIVTNNHVVEGKDLVEVRRFDGTRGIQKVVKRDPVKDLALIQTNQKGRPLQLATGERKLGESVDIIGHPGGAGYQFSYSLSRGIISAIRLMKSGVLGSGNVKFIQTDASINPGNSGGPLLVGGEVVGVITQKVSKEGIEGLGFAVHVDELRAFVRGAPLRDIEQRD